MKPTRNAFTLVEMLIVIAIISILAAMAISSFSNAAQDSRAVVVSQQLASVQEAVNNWAARRIGKVTKFANDPTVGGNPTSIEQVCVIYNAATTASGRLAIFADYLDESTRSTISADDTTGRVTSDAMRQTGRWLTLPDWDSAVGKYPKVQITP